MLHTGTTCIWQHSAVHTSCWSVVFVRNCIRGCTYWGDCLVRDERRAITALPIVLARPVYVPTLRVWRNPLLLTNTNSHWPRPCLNYIRILADQLQTFAVCDPCLSMHQYSVLVTLKTHDRRQAGPAPPTCPITIKPKGQNVNATSARLSAIIALGAAQRLHCVQRAVQCLRCVCTCVGG